MSQSEMYLRSIGQDLASALPGGFTYFKSSRELRRATANGYDVVVLAGSSKYSPHISVSFYFGKNYAPVKRLEKALRSHQAPYHIQQYSPSAPSMEGLNYRGPHTWDIDITDPAPNSVTEIREAIQQVAYPFFDRFSQIVDARDAFSADDSWCFNGRMFWHHLLKLDAVLGDIEHFRRWSKCLEPFELSQANAMIDSISALPSRAI